MNEQNASKGSPRPNRLINEQSPYLLQHAYNPVDWYPWGDEALAKAKKENKPIFLSIGYSSCHWCHVLAHESFEDSDVADYLNQNFVSVKVDREERPEIDEIYMKAVMSMTGSGGWPLSVFLTPSLEPIFGGTYFPPTPRNGMPSFINVAKGVAGSWKNERKNVVESARQIKESLARMYLFRKSSDSTPNETLLEECYSSLAGAFDDANGGFGDSPKFPMPSNLFFLMRYYHSKRSKLAVSMVTKTLDAMMRGGIHDHIGGGFHRYSTDRYWIVPHFEKMLYDNALLAIAYIEAFLVTKNESYAQVARETLSWAMREMRSEEGGFYSSKDADSPNGEGSFYVWNPVDVRDALKDRISRSDVVLSYFSVTSGGNFEGSKTILTTKPIEIVAKEFGMNMNELQRVIEDAKKIMLDYRNHRSPPAIDEKIIASWNGLMLSALSKAYSAFGEKSYLTDAIAAAELILTRMTAEDGQRLSRSYCSGEARGDGVLEDYAFFINGLIDLYEASFKPKYLKNAISLCETMISKFKDQAGAFYFSNAEARNLIVRAKDGYDGALPSGNSMAALALARLSEFTTRDDFRQASREVIDVFHDAIEMQPSSFTQMLVAFQFLWGKPKEVVISGNPDSRETEALVSTLRSEFLPNSVVLFAEKEIENFSPLAKGRIPSQSDRPRVFVCSNFSCHLPVNSSEELASALMDQASSGQKP